MLSPQFPGEYTGGYFFADLCGGWIGHYDPATDSASLDFATGIEAPVDLAVAPGGGLYYLARGGGLLVRIDFVAEGPPVIAQGPADQTVGVGRPAMFTVAAIGPAPLVYQWMRDGAVIPGATGADYLLPSAALADSGARFSVLVTNSQGEVASSAATLTVVASNAKARAPSARAVPTGRVARPRR